MSWPARGAFGPVLPPAGHPADDQPRIVAPAASRAPAPAARARRGDSLRSAHRHHAASARTCAMPSGSLRSSTNTSRLRARMSSAAEIAKPVTCRRAARCGSRAHHDRPSIMPGKGHRADRRQLDYGNPVQCPCHVSPRACCWRGDCRSAGGLSRLYPPSALALSCNARASPGRCLSASRQLRPGLGRKRIGRLQRDRPARAVASAASASPPRSCACDRSASRRTSLRAAIVAQIFEQLLRPRPVALPRRQAGREPHRDRAGGGLQQIGFGQRGRLLLLPGHDHCRDHALEQAFGHPHPRGQPIALGSRSAASEQQLHVAGQRLGIGRSGRDRAHALRRSFRSRRNCALPATIRLAGFPELRQMAGHRNARPVQAGARPMLALPRISCARATSVSR